MEQPHAEAFNMQKMLADYMENGLLENITDMFKHDKTLYDYIPDLIKDERMRVRIGTIALLETLAVEDPDNTEKVVRLVIPLLKDSNLLVVGDAVYILGLIGNQEVIPFLEKLIPSEDPDLRTIAQEAVKDIRSRQ